jgi:hypothetical protein
MGQVSQRLLPSFVYLRGHSRIDFPFEERQWVGAHGKRPYSVMQSNNYSLLAERAIDSCR